MDISAEFWRHCSTCKKQINYSAKYYECSVSTCSGKRTGYVFCSVQCFETHLPGARHRDAWAIEKKSPTYAEYKAENSAEAPKRIIVGSSTSSSATSTPDHEVLVVVSKMKQYVKDKADMNTSGDVADVLSKIIRHACDQAIDQARADGRKTLMARDFK